MISETDTHERLIDVLEDFDDAMLVTRALDGALRSRPMHVAKFEEDGTLYFATSDDSAKADEIEREPAVNVVFQDDRTYLSLSGTARLVDDRALVESLYKPAWKVWFPEGKDDPNLRILEVDAQRGEYWDVTGAGWVRYVYEAGKALVRGGEVEGLGAEHHAKVEL